MSGGAPRGASGPSTAADLTRRLDRDRHVLAMLMPPERRPAVLALFAFNIETARIADLVRDPMIGALRLQYWRDIVAAGADRTPPAAARGNPVAEALATDTLPGLPADARARLLDLLAARLDDLTPDPPPDTAAARALAARTSGALAVVNAALLGAVDADSQRRAEAVGTAWGLLGLARATPALLARGRHRLPADVAGQRPGASGVRAGVAALADAAWAELGGLATRNGQADRRLKPVLAQAAHARVLLWRLRRAGHDPAASVVAGRPVPVLRLLLARTWPDGTA